MKKLLIIELSEFNIELLNQAAQLYSLSHLSKILQFKKSSYKTNDRYNSGYLTPEAQWSAIHAGISARKVPSPTKFFWEVLNEHKIKTTLWGGQENPCSIKLDMHSHDLPNKWDRLKNNLKLLKQAFKLGCFSKILKEILSFKLNSNPPCAVFPKYLSWLEYISVILFCQLKQKENKQKKTNNICSILSLHSLAYCQYYHWEGDDKNLNPELAYNLKLLDKTLGELIKQFPEESIIVHNALSQIKTPKINQNTGRFIPLGTIYSQDLNFPNHIFNYEFSRYIYHYFLPELYSLKSEYIEDEVFCE